MAFGLEARTPFLDHELVELAAACPPALKLAHGGKGVLKDAARRVLPARGHRPPQGLLPGPRAQPPRGSRTSSSCARRSTPRRRATARSSTRRGSPACSPSPTSTSRRCRATPCGNSACSSCGFRGRASDGAARPPGTRSSCPASCSAATSLRRPTPALEIPGTRAAPAAAVARAPADSRRARPTRTLRRNSAHRCEIARALGGREGRASAATCTSGVIEARRGQRGPRSMPRSAARGPQRPRASGARGDRHERGSIRGRLKGRSRAYSGSEPVRAGRRHRSDPAGVVERPRVPPMPRPCRSARKPVTSMTPAPNSVA